MQKTLLKQIKWFNWRDGNNFTKFRSFYVFFDMIIITVK